MRFRGGGTLALLLAGLAAAAPEAATQERPERPMGPVPAPVAAPRGWLGIEFHWEQLTGREGPALVIRQVMPGSPAERAELRAGDRIRSFGGMAPDPISVQARAARLRPGDTITLEVMRPPEGRARQVTVQAAQRPAMVAMGPGGEWLSFSPDTLQVRLRVNMDSIRTEMERQLRQAEDRIVIVRSLAEEARRDGEAVRRVWEEGDFVAFRTGQRVVAGAEVTPLNPDLARYFGTESGVLTVEVLEDTPAARGGLRGGDVIVRVGDEGVSSVAQLRTALELGYRSPPVPVTVIREGREMQLLLPR